MTTWTYQHVDTMLAAYKRAFATLKSNPNARIRMNWACDGLDLQGFRRNFVNALNRRINLKVDQPRNWRKLDPQWQIAAWRDSRRLQDMARRIRVYQFETTEAKARFGDRLARYDD